MSLWLSETKTTGLWKGGLWKSQQGSPYAFNLDLTTFKDTVTGQSLSCNIDGTRYDEVNGVTTAFATDVPTIADNGLRICGAYSNLVKYSEQFNNTSAYYKEYSSVYPNEALSPQNTMTADLLYTSIGQFKGYISTIPAITVSLNTKYNISYFAKTTDVTKKIEWAYRNGDTSQTKIPILSDLNNDTWKRLNVTTNTTTQTALIAYLIDKRNLAGGCLTAYAWGLQVSNKNYSLPYIPTTDSTVSSPSEAGNSATGTGIWIDDVASNFPFLNTALTSQGTLTFKWTTGFNDADVSGNLNILSFDGTTDSAISYDADNNLIKITDGTNTASKALTVVADTEYTIQATWGLVSGSPKMQIAVNGTAGTQATFAGTFNPSDIYFGLENQELQYICKNPDGHDLTVLKEATWL